MKSAWLWLAVIAITLMAVSFLAGFMISSNHQEISAKSDSDSYWAVEAINFDLAAMHSDIPEGWEPFATGILKDMTHDRDVLYIFIRKIVKH